MKQLIIAMIITNILVIAQVMIDRNDRREEEMNKRVVAEELIPIEFELIGE